MRWSCLPVALAAALLPYCASADQVSWQTRPPSTSSTTLVDVLGTDPDYLSLLRLLQVTRLIPTLNRLNGSTIFAPTNDAIKRYTKHQQLWGSILEDDSFMVTDNIREQLRQQLFYHLLNYTLASGSDDVVRQQDTLHFPQTSLDPPTHEPPPHPPWMPEPGGSLGGKPQRLRTVTQEGALHVGVDAFGSSGARVVKDRLDASNGAVLGIDQVLEPPPSLSQVIDQLPNAAYFSKILGPEALKRLNDTKAMTLFLPVDDAWKSLDPYERLYLESDFAADDLNRILNMHAVAEDSVKWSDSFGKKGTTFTSLDDTKLEIAVTDDGTTVGSAKLLHPDIYASNGVMHLVSDLLIPPGALQITPEKYLLALNCSTFVSLIRSVGLRHLVNDTEAHYTILAPSDDILSVLGAETLPDPGSDDLKRMLAYHFIPGKWTPKQLEDGLLLKTELKEEGLNGEPQVLPVDVGESKKPGGHIRFGGAGVIGEPIQVNGTVIYFISRPLLPPADPLDTVLPDLDLSSFLASVLSSAQSDTLRNTPQTSLLIPYNTAFQRLGVLVTTHLLSSNAKPDLEKVLLHHALSSVEYAPELLNGGKQTFQTLEGSDIKVERKSNGTLFISPSGGWAGMKSQLIPRNTLTKTGVIHELSDVLIPRTVDITIGKLIKASQGSTMATLINKAGFDWVLNGTAPPEGSEWEDIDLEGAGWTLLCPPDDAFKDLNLTELYSDEAAMKDIVSQHLIPVPTPNADLVETDTDTDVLNNNRPLVLEGSTYTTIRSSSSAYGDLVFQKRVTDGQFVVGIKGARGTDSDQDWARVVSWGRSTTGSGTGGVIQIDRLLVPYQPKWWVEYGGPSAVGVTGILAICGFFYGVRIFMLRDTTEATYEPVGGFGRDDDEA